MSVRKGIIYLLITALLTMVSGGVFVYFLMLQSNLIRVGILHSQTGTMAMSELPVIDATLLAIEEINRAGGLLGKIIEPVVVDGASDPTTFASLSEKLIIEDKVSVIFGCWTSASRKMVKEVVEKYNHLLFYPIQYEGLEDSHNIVYTGAAPNQQIIPAAIWSFYNLGKKIFLVGSDYVFPRTANELIKDCVKVFGAKIVGEAYQPLGSTVFKAIVQEIVKAQPDVIISTINGSSNFYFFKELRSAGVSSDKIPTMALSISEEELKAVGKLAGDYATRNYFQSIQRPQNIEFVEAFKKKYSSGRVLSDPLEAAYFGVYLWAQAVKSVGTAHVETIKEAIKKQGREAPEGIVYIDPDNNHTWKTVRVGKIMDDGQFFEVWDSKKSVHPVPFPQVAGYFKEWRGFLERLYESWNKKWSA